MMIELLALGLLVLTSAWVAAAAAVERRLDPRSWAVVGGLLPAVGAIAAVSMPHRPRVLDRQSVLSQSDVARTLFIAEPLAGADLVAVLKRDRDAVLRELDLLHALSLVTNDGTGRWSLTELGRALAAGKRDRIPTVPPDQRAGGGTPHPDIVSRTEDRGSGVPAEQTVH